ncbi:MAG: hypothetical protein Ct9H90mP5_09150 [Acidimicrobiaceae bacterium]|nr:MAG: hypothetical protein Ct9H90mP5_09150 [Acidimicrobiaceae bacterium]
MENVPALKFLALSEVTLFPGRAGLATFREVKGKDMQANAFDMGKRLKSGLEEELVPLHGSVTFGEED